MAKVDSEFQCFRGADTVCEDHLRLHLAVRRDVGGASAEERLPAVKHELTALSILFLRTN